MNRHLDCVSPALNAARSECSMRPELRSPGSPTGSCCPRMPPEPRSRRRRRLQPRASLPPADQPGTSPSTCPGCHTPCRPADRRRPAIDPESRRRRPGRHKPRVTDEGANLNRRVRIGNRRTPLDVDHLQVCRGRRGPARDLYDGFPPAVVKSPPTRRTEPYGDSARTVLFVPAPSAVQVAPSHPAMLFTVVPAGLSK